VSLGLLYTSEQRLTTNYKGTFKMLRRNLLISSMLTPVVMVAACNSNGTVSIPTSLQTAIADAPAIVTASQTGFASFASLLPAGDVTTVNGYLQKAEGLASQVAGLATAALQAGSLEGIVNLVLSAANTISGDVPNPSPALKTAITTFQAVVTVAQAILPIVAPILGIVAAPANRTPALFQSNMSLDAARLYVHSVRKQ
jgi:hypothetical protein